MKKSLTKYTKSMLIFSTLVGNAWASLPPPSLADFWAGTARFQNEERVRFPGTPYELTQDFYFNTHDSGMTVIQDPQNPSNIYYLAESWYINSGNLEPHIYRSTDGGLNFSHLTAIFNIADRDDPGSAAAPGSSQAYWDYEGKQYSIFQMREPDIIYYNGSYYIIYETAGKDFVGGSTVIGPSVVKLPSLDITEPVTVNHGVNFRADPLFTTYDGNPSEPGAQTTSVSTPNWSFPYVFWTGIHPLESTWERVDIYRGHYSGTTEPLTDSFVFDESLITNPNLAIDPASSVEIGSVDVKDIEKEGAWYYMLYMAGNGTSPWTPGPSGFVVNGVTITRSTDLVNWQREFTEPEELIMYTRDEPSLAKGFYPELVKINGSYYVYYYRQHSLSPSDPLIARTYRMKLDWWMAPENVGHPAIQGASDDVLQNAVVTADSGMHSAGFLSSDLFSSGSGLFAEDAIFADGVTGTTQFVEFNTASAVALKYMVIGLSNDEFVAAPDYRSISNVKVYAGTSPGAGVSNLVADVAVNPEYTDTYGGNHVALRILFDAAVNAQYFRMEFEEAKSAETEWAGARVYEIDGYITDPPVTAATFTPLTLEQRQGSNGDAFDGVAVTAHSALHPLSSDPNDWFLSPNATEHLFSDTIETKFIDFNTTNTIALTNLVVYLSGDDVGGIDEDRTVASIKLYASPVAGVWDGGTLACDIVVNPDYTATYGSAHVKVSIDLNSVPGQYFRMEFVQPHAGSRVMEIDGYGGPYVPVAAIPATILSLTTFSPGIMKMVVDAPDFANRYHPEATGNLMLGAWGNVPHSTNGLAPFIVTNLAYSASEGTSEVIYVETGEPAEFFKVTGE